MMHRLGAGDCLGLGPPVDCVYRNPDDGPVRYLVAVTRRQAVDHVERDG